MEALRLPFLLNHGIICFSLFLLVGTISGFILYLFYLPIKYWLLKSKRIDKVISRKINYIYVTCIFLIVCYASYISIYPGNDFFEAEFNIVTLKKLPKSAEFISTHASYPGFKGDYCSSSQIRLPHKEYMKLLKQMQDDKSLAETVEQMSFVEFENALQDKNKENIEHGFIRQIEGEEDRYYYIGFYNDHQTIFINVCYT